MISEGFSISSWRDFSSSSEACLFSVSSPYMGIISRSAWPIIFISLILISCGENFFFNFFDTSCTREFFDSEVFSRCSFGTMRECPLLIGISSRIAMLSLSSAIL